MAVTNHSSNSVTVSNKGSIAVTLDTVSGDKIIVCIQLNSNHTVSGITDTVGSAYTSVPGSPVTNGVGLSVEMWRATAAATNASNSITVSFSAKSTGEVEAADYPGWASEGNTNTATGNSTTPDITLNPLQAPNSWAVASLGIASTGTISANIGNLRQSQVNSVGGALNDRPGDGSTGGTNSYVSPELENKITDSSGAVWACIVLELRAVGGPIKHRATVNGKNTVAAASLVLPSLNTVSGDEVSVLVAFASATTISSITDSVGSTYSQFFAPSGGFSIWVATAAGTSSTNAITINFAASTKSEAVASTHGGMASRGITANSSGVSTAPTVDLITQDPNNFVWGGFDANSSNDSCTATTGDLLDQNIDASILFSEAGLFNASATAADTTIAGTLAVSTAWISYLYELRTAGAKQVPSRNLLGVGS